MADAYEKPPQSVHLFHECILGASTEINRAHLGIDDIIHTLENRILPWGRHLMLVSSKYMVDGFTDIKKRDGKILLHGSENCVQPDAQGFYTTPRDIYAIVGENNNPLYAAIVVDNRAPGTSQYAHRKEQLKFPCIDGKNTMYADTARRPILIIPRESNLVHPHPRQSFLDSWRKEHCSRRKP